MDTCETKKLRNDMFYVLVAVVFVVAVLRNRIHFMTKGTAINAVVTSYANH